jgi:hypothetical protein
MRIRKEKIVTWNCGTCGFNGVQIRKSVRKRVTFCQCCNQQVVIKKVFPFNNSYTENSQYFIQKIALGWG